MRVAHAHGAAIEVEHTGMIDLDRSRFERERPELAARIVPLFFAWAAIVEGREGPLRSGREVRLPQREVRITVGAATRGERDAVLVPLTIANDEARPFTLSVLLSVLLSAWLTDARGQRLGLDIFATQGPTTAEPGQRLDTIIIFSGRDANPPFQLHLKPSLVAREILVFDLDGP